MILKLFTQPTCPKCPVAKEMIRKIKSKGLKIEYYDITTVDGMAEASFYTVMATPTILVLNDEEKIIQQWRGETPTEKEMIFSLK